MESVVVGILLFAAVLFLGGMAIYRLLKGPKRLFRGTEPAERELEERDRAARRRR